MSHLNIYIEFILNKIRIFLAYLILSFALPVFAQEKVDIYTVVLPVENQLEPQRQDAFATALQQVVGNLSASPNVKSDADLSEIFAHPERYVESYSYLSDPEQTDVLQIVVHFDSQALGSFFPQQHVAQSQRLNVQISGITSAETLNAAMHFLRQINTVKSVMIEQVSGENIILSVFLQGNSNSFAQILIDSQHFVSLSAEDSDQSTLQFKWVGE
ncbi:MAG: DUF2066 domain-containing protein [Pseudomonadota bacterium]